MNHFKIRDLAVMGILIAIAFAGQVAMAFLPNIEIVSLLFIVYTLVLGRKVFFVIYGFVFLEGIFYGFGLWWVNYLYIWSVLALLTWLFRRQTSVIFWSILSGFFGISFGALCAIPYFFIGGVSSALAYWVSSIPFDILHCIGNVVVCLALFKPLSHVLQKAVPEHRIYS